MLTIAMNNKRPIVCAVFSTDDFGNEIQTIPGEHCLLNVSPFCEAMIIDPYAWDRVLGLGVREHE